MVNSSQPSHVLVVDDEWLIRWALKQALEAKGYRVTEAADAFSARHVLADLVEKPDAVVLDYRLPDSDDLNLLAGIRQNSPAMPVIMMTAHSTPELVKGALDLGAYRVVSKPFEVLKMADLVSEALTTG